MDRNLVIGLVILGLALVAMILLVLRSRSIINRLAETRPRSVRDALRDLRNGRRP